MCGLAGYIGSSKKPKISYELATALFDSLEIRGMDASGIWGTEPGNGSIIYHKEPVNSSRFIIISSLIRYINSFLFPEDLNCGYTK